MTKTIPLTLVALALAAAFASAGCCSERIYHLSLSDKVRRPQKAVVIFLVDDLDKGVMGELLAAGRLPNIKQYLCDRGVAVDHAVTTVPAITFAAIPSIVTGQFPGHHHIAGNRWFDRYQLRLASYKGIRRYLDVNEDFFAPTLFEMTPELHSTAILVSANRGATRPIANWMSAGLTHFFCSPEMVDSLTADRMSLIAREAELFGRWPDILLAYFWMPDHQAHEFGKDSKEYRHILVNLDVEIGRMCANLREAGMLDRSLLVLITDHGCVRTDPAKRVAMRDVLEKRFGMKTAYEPTPRKLEYTQRYLLHAADRVAMTDDGDRRVVLHLRAGDDWRVAPTLGQIERFHRDYGGPAVRANADPFWKVALDAIGGAARAGQLVAVRAGDGQVLVSDGVGAGRVERRVEGPVHPFRARASSYRYTVTAPPDPLRLAEDGVRLADGEFHSSEQWLSATCGGRFPDLVPQIVEYFDSPRAGDVVLFAPPGMGFTAGNRSGHGGVTPPEMVVPLVFAGPGVPAGGRLMSARSVDILPTVLEFLGRLDALKAVNPIDGISRLGELGRAVAAPATQPGR